MAVAKSVSYKEYNKICARMDARLILASRYGGCGQSLASSFLHGPLISPYRLSLWCSLSCCGTLRQRHPKAPPSFMYICSTPDLAQPALFHTVGSSHVLPSLSCAGSHNSVLCCGWQVGEVLTSLPKHICIAGNRVRECLFPIPCLPPPPGPVLLVLLVTGLREC